MTPAAPTNVARRFVHELGDPDAGFGEADVIVERRYRTEAVHQGYIEPHSATVYWDKDKITVWTSTQGHFGIREQVAKVVGVPVSKIKVIPMEIGGGFGGKTIIYVEPVAAVLSRKTGQPVKITMSRTEVFFGTGPTSGTDITMKIGATNAGRITAATVDMVYEGRGLSRVAAGVGVPLHLRGLRRRQPAGRRPRRGGEQAEGRRLPRAGGARRGLRGGTGGR